MKIPEVGIDVWKKLYKAAADFQAREPWEVLSDSDLFGVRDPSSGQIGYCCVMGTLGEFFALGMYRGSEGLACYLGVQSGVYVDDQAHDELFAMQNALMAEFCTRSDLDKEDIVVSKALGFKPRKSARSPAFFRFRDHSPGFIPWFISESDARWLTFALQCASDIAEAIQEDDTLLEPEKPGHYLVYVPRDTGGEELSWTRRWLAPDPARVVSVPTVPVDDIRLQKIRNTTLKRGAEWEVDVFFLRSGTIMDRDRPYYARCLMVACKRSGMLLNVQMLPPEPPSHRTLQGMLLDTITKHGVLPAEIHFRRNLMLEAFGPLAEKLVCALRSERTLPAIDEAKEALNRQMGAGFR